ncbi:MAG TPA: hypothetical protein VFM34_00165 [Moraxellaceae bacterium]|nr:hypothetical protein [Moraxellaceae bacterium]
MTIDWTKPLELEDGTPVTIYEDYGDGFFSLGRADGEQFTFRQAGNNPLTAVWRKDGLRFGNGPGLRVRNVAEAASDTPPQWAIDRAYELVGEGYAYTAFARYIAEHEQPPVDPDLLTAREICARVADEIGREGDAGNYRDGIYDFDEELKFALSKLREARG